MKKSNNKEFSKILLIQESILIWITTLAYILLAFYCIVNGYMGTLPWLSAGVALPWAAYGVSQAFYYNKSKSENTCGGIKYEMTLRDFEYSNTTTSVPSSTGTDDIDLNGPI